VIKLLQWINSNSLKKKGIGGNDKVWKDSKGNIHIRREAKNDNWY
jgi:hypothetical protein